MVELLPCPFCGGLAKPANTFSAKSIRCSNDKCSVQTLFYQIENPAIEAWNTRAESATILTLRDQLAAAERELAQRKIDDAEYRKRTVLDRFHDLASKILVKAHAQNLSASAVENLAEQLVRFTCVEARPYLESANDWRARAELAEAKIKKAVEPTRRVYLDLDGVMADFDAHFPAVFGLDHRSMADDAMWATINAHPSYFRDMPPCVGAVEFFKSIEHLRPIILTACPKTNYVNAATQKRAWVREHLSPHVTVLPVMGGRHKPLFMQESGDILIDDWRKNTEAWEAAGGIAILHRDFATTLNELRTTAALGAAGAMENGGEDAV